jgi:fido (protein-threonine AMPylation protein)
MLNLDKLTEFNPALIYSFEPEASGKPMGSEAFWEALFPAAGQHQDLFDAYLFAQAEILPQLRGQQGKIKKQQLLDWINTLHGILGKTLFESFGQEAGKYIERSVLRWHPGSAIKDHLIYYLSKAHFCKNDKALVAYLVERFHVEEEAILAFIKLVRKIGKNSGIGVHESQIPFLEKSKNTFFGVLALNKMQTAYYTEGILTAEEKKVIDKIVKICRYPHEMPSAMNAFAEQTIAAFEQCEPTNLEQISKFLTDLFYNFTDIHPYANANGRTGTAIINIFLRYFNLPSILLRHPGEKTDENSDYSKAIAQINESTQPLQNLIKKRILDAQQSDFSNDKLRQIISLRVELTDILKRIQRKHPNYDLELMQNKVNIIFLSLQSTDEETASLELLTEVMKHAVAEEMKLDKPHPVPYSLNALNNSQKTNLISGLESLTGKSGWKLNQRNGLITWVESTDKVEAQSIQDRLMKLNVATLTLAQRKDNPGIWVVKCEHINYFKLLEEASHREGISLGVECKMG